MLILGLETSCDETSAAVVADGRTILSNKISSQIDLHAKTGGVVPEVASRKHVEQIGWIIEESLAEAGIGKRDLGAIAVSNRPGLLGALLVGVSAAKTLAYALELPLLGVHHIEAHIYANWLVDPDIEFPVICLVVSGGHTEIFLVRGHGDYQVLGRTRDDAAGEAFDKSARLLGFPYPGGIAIDRLAATGGNREAIPFPRARLGPQSLDFSFSGLKTAVLNARSNPAYQATSLEDWSASIQEAIVDVLVEKTMRAAKEYSVAHVLLAGGVAANSRLQQRFREETARLGIGFTSPPTALCTDNAAMIACAGYYHWLNGQIDGLELDTIPSERLA